MEIDPVNGLRNGIDVNDALHTMVFDDASYSLGEDQLQRIAEELAFLDPSLAEEFRQGQKLLEQRLENERQVAASERESKLRAVTSSTNTSSDLVTIHYDTPAAAHMAHAATG